MHLFKKKQNIHLDVKLSSNLHIYSNIGHIEYQPLKQYKS